MFIYTHTHTHTHIYIYIYIYTHMYVCKRNLPNVPLEDIDGPWSHIIGYPHPSPTLPPLKSHITGCPPPPPPPPITFLDLPLIMLFWRFFKNNFYIMPSWINWCNKGRGMCYPVCGMVHIKEPLLLIWNSSLCCSSGFPFSLSEWSLTICLTPYNRK